jgi:hypothetical protein
MKIDSSLCVILVLLSIGARADDITSKINGKWQEFENGGAAPVYVTPCLFGCSSFNSSEPLGSNGGPWTFTSSGCTILTVLEGRGTGTTIFEVEDNGVSLGNTSMGVRLNDCQDDPDFCYKDQYAGKGSFLLLAGSHSFHIKQVYEVSPYVTDHAAVVPVSTWQCLGSFLLLGILQRAISHFPCVLDQPWCVHRTIALMAAGSR